MLRSALGLVGRLPIVIMLLLPALMLIKEPARYKLATENALQAFNQITTYIHSEFSLRNAEPILTVRIFGVFQLLTALFILLGDSFGGYFYATLLAGSFLVKHHAAIQSMTILQWGLTQALQLTPFLGLLGIAFCLMKR